MTTNLLTPRVRVIANYPGSRIPIGIILSEWLLPGWWYWSGGGHKIYTNPVESPAIFQPLKWWEYREIGDMPEYVKDNMKGSIVIKVHEYLPLGGGFISEANAETGYASPIDIFLPATESEYLEFKNRAK